MAAAALLLLATAAFSVGPADGARVVGRSRRPPRAAASVSQDRAAAARTPPALPASATGRPAFDAQTVRVRSTDVDADGKPTLPLAHAGDASLLVMINSYSFDAAASRVPATLETLVTWCDEHGQDVHVALYTASPALGNYALAADHRSFCQRRGRRLPTLVLEYDRNITIHISGMHRYLVTATLDAYDHFMYAEDDLALRWAHVQYLQEWTHLLAPGGWLPHLVRYEITPLPGSRAALVHDEAPLPASLARVAGALHVRLPNPYMAMWMLPARVLAPFVRDAAWHAQVARCPSADPRVFFATFWLLPHFNFTVPLHQWRHALVQHVSTHYADEARARLPTARRHAAHPAMLHQWYNTDALDMEADLLECAGDVGGRLGEHRVQRLNQSLAAACGRCLEGGRAALLACTARRDGEDLVYSVSCA